MYFNDLLVFYSAEAMPKIPKCRMQVATDTLSSNANSTAFPFFGNKDVCGILCQMRGGHSDPMLMINGVSLHSKS